MKYILLLFSLLTIYACSNLSPKEKDLGKIINTKIDISSFNSVQQENEKQLLKEVLKKKEYISLVFLKEDCNSCYFKFIEWIQKIDSVNIPENYTLVFIIQGTNYKRFISKIKDIDNGNTKNKYYTIMDPMGSYLKKNSNIPRWIIDASVLINSENKIKMVGAPFATPEMTELFHEICAK